MHVGPLEPLTLVGPPHKGFDDAYPQEVLLKDLVQIFKTLLNLDKEGLCDPDKDRDQHKRHRYQREHYRGETWIGRPHYAHTSDKHEWGADEHPKAHEDDHLDMVDIAC